MKNSLRMLIPLNVAPMPEAAKELALLSVTFRSLNLYGKLLREKTGQRCVKNTKAPKEPLLDS